jgi:deoxyribodipyrimidine photolyase-related protein
MACVAQAVQGSLQHAYAHHIQRLMVTGNIALLLGCHPDELDAWYLGIYIDAFEWVEQPNTRGMSQWADGGFMASKPYVSGGAYLARMGDHCAHCRYAVKQKTGPGACPFNSLYWHFLARHEAKLAANPRLAMPYASWRKMDEGARQALLTQAEAYLQDVDSL